LSDIYGPPRHDHPGDEAWFVAGLGAVCAGAEHARLLILRARGLAGPSGGGGILPIVQTVISDVVTPREARPVIRLFQRAYGSRQVSADRSSAGVFRRASATGSMIFWINVPLGLGFAGAAGCRIWGRIPVVSPQAARSTGWAACLLMGLRRCFHAGG